MRKSPAQQFSAGVSAMAALKPQEESSGKNNTERPTGSQVAAQVPGLPNETATRAQPMCGVTPHARRKSEMTWDQVSVPIGPDKVELRGSGCGGSQDSMTSHEAFEAGHMTSTHSRVAFSLCLPRLFDGRPGSGGNGGVD
jgi:hypothetical protein